MIYLKHDQTTNAKLLTYLPNVWKKYSLKILKAENGKLGKRQREHDTKDNPRRAPVVPNRRGP
jgi:hypothetical protein